MPVMTMSCRNKDHVDGVDHCLGITLWHKSNPSTEKQVACCQLKGWDFLFLSMEVQIGEEWKKDIMACLQHSTIVTSDT